MRAIQAELDREINFLYQPRFPFALDGTSPLSPPPLDQNLFAIHYQTEWLQGGANGTRMISSIALRQVLTGESILFSAHLEGELLCSETGSFKKFLAHLEKRVLERFSKFLFQYPAINFIHWNMNDTHFGFEVLGQQFPKHFGIDLTVPQTEQRFDLSGFLKQNYTRDFEDHPYLENAIKRNGLYDRKFLPQNNEKAAWLTENYQALDNSLKSKVRAIGDLYQLLQKGELKIKQGTVGLLPKGNFELQSLARIINPEPPQRLKIDAPTKTVTLDGQNFTISNPVAFNLFTAIAKADGNLKKTPDLKALPQCHGVKIDRVFRAHLPQELRKTVKGKRGNGGGYHLQLPPQIGPNLSSSLGPIEDKK